MGRGAHDIAQRLAPLRSASTAIDKFARREIAERTGLSIELGNDANAAALGEWLFGAGKGLRDLVYITVSTGIGGGVIADGRLLLAHRGSAAEVGHHIIDAATGASWEDLAGTGSSVVPAMTC